MIPETRISQLRIPLSRATPNFAPARPIADAIRNKKPNKRPSRFEQAFREWYTAKLNYEKTSRDERISAAHLVALFRQGNQLGVYRRPYGAAGYYVRPLVGDDTSRQTAMNIMTFHSQVCESKVMASNPNVNMRAGDDTPEAIAAAQACRPVVDCYETDWYTGKFSRREAIRFLTDGMVIYEVKWNPFKGKHELQERTVSRRDVTIDPGAGVCADCNHEGEADEFEPANFGFTCPQCKSNAVDVRAARTRSMPQIGPGQSRPVGEPELSVSSFMSWHWDMRVDLECSPWAIKRQRITHGDVNLLLGDVSIPDSGSSQDYGLDVLHALAYSGQALQGSSWTTMYGPNYTSINNQPTMFEAWMSPEDQACIEVEEGDTIAGVKMAKGRLSDFFRGQPCCVVGLNDGALILGTFAGESQQQSVITAHWFMDADSGSGRGMEDTASVQRRANQVDGQIYQGLAQSATPAAFVDRSILKEDDGKYIFRPGQNVYVNLSMLPPNTHLPDAFWMPRPGNINQQYIQYGTVYLKQMADMSSLAVEFSETLLSIDNRTATGAQITAGLANSLYGPMLISKGEVRVEIAKKIIQLVSQHAIAGQYYPGKGAAKGRMVAGEDLKGKVVFELVQNSQLPVTPFSQQTDIRIMVESFGGIQGVMMLKQTDPALFRQLSAPFNVKTDYESEDDVSNLCLERLEQMKGNLKAGMTEPAELVKAIHPPVSMYEPKHQEKADWYSRWLDLESAQEAPLELRQAAEQMYILHLNLLTQRQLPQAFNQGMVGAAQAAPAALGQAALQPQQDAPAEQDDSAQIEADERMEHEKRETELQTKQMESETALGVARTQAQGQLANTALAGKNQLANTEKAGQNAVRVQRAKPKPKTAAKKSA